MDGNLEPLGEREMAGAVSAAALGLGGRGKIGGTNWGAPSGWRELFTRRA